MTKKIYLQTLKKCPGSLCFPLLVGAISFQTERFFGISIFVTTNNLIKKTNS